MAALDGPPAFHLIHRGAEYDEVLLLGPPLVNTDHIFLAFTTTEDGQSFHWTLIQILVGQSMRLGELDVGRAAPAGIPALAVNWIC